MAMPSPLPGLLAGSFRGVSFFVPDISNTVGRRVAAHYFPGIDYAAYDDHGLNAETIQLEALYVGDDYIAHGKALRLAFETPGPGTLMHPWFGAMNVVLIEPAEISFSSSELRVVRFEASFERVLNRAQAGVGRISTTPALISAGIALAQSAMAMIDSVNNNTLSRLRSDATTRTASRYFAAWRNLQGTAANVLQAQLPTTAPTTPQSFSDIFHNLSRTLVDMTANDTGLSAVAPAAGAIHKQNLAPALALAVTRQVADTLLNQHDDAPSVTDQALNAAVIADILGAAAVIIADVEPDSRKDALTIRQQITDILDRYSNSLQSLFDTGFSAAASNLHSNATNTRLRIIADINETMGRLPQTIIVTLSGNADAWIIANMLYGDDPAKIEHGYLDMITRNRISHPALLEAGPLEILP